MKCQAGLHSQKFQPNIISQADVLLSKDLGHHAVVCHSKSCIENVRCIKISPICVRSGVIYIFSL